MKKINFWKQHWIIQSQNGDCGYTANIINVKPFSASLISVSLSLKN